MFRITKNIKTLTLATEIVNSTLQIVRWRRKPLWMPTAKSKLFRVAPRIVLATDENEELKRLFNNYRTVTKSLRNFLRHKYAVSETKNVDEAHRKAVVLEDFARCNGINNNWNEVLRVERVQYFENVLLRQIEEAQHNISEKEELKKANVVLAEELVRKEKGESLNFVTSENINAAIEQALANPVDYNYAIDLDGNRYQGRDARPSVSKEAIVMKQ